ncbi:hypothetical protein LTS08_003252 [Lithohypha guttulata]|nr:hypothetical protein LTS08_003252 [Lithohypha guttulata]
MAFDPTAYGSPSSRKQHKSVASTVCKQKVVVNGKPRTATDEAIAPVPAINIVQQQASHTTKVESTAPRLPASSDTSHVETHRTSTKTSTEAQPLAQDDSARKPDDLHDGTRPLLSHERTESTLTTAQPDNKRDTNLGAPARSSKCRIQEPKDQQPQSCAPSQASVSNMSPIQRSEDVAARLKSLQTSSMQKISRRVEAKKHRSKDQHDTTSLKDLDHARKIVNPEQPAASRRPWAEESPVTNPDRGEQYATHKTLRNMSHVAQAASTHLTETPGVASARPDPVQSRSKWATKEELRDEKQEVDSNAWSSAVAPSDATRASNVSDRTFGKLLNQHKAEQEAELFDWEGHFVPAPADWGDRPRYNNNNPTFKAAFKRWLSSVSKSSSKAHSWSNGVAYMVVPAHVLEDIDNVADGISMVRQNTTIGLKNAVTYGYVDQPEEVVKYSQPIQVDDFKDWGKLDLSDANNAEYGKERSQDLIDNWLAHLTNARNASIDNGVKLEAETERLEDMLPLVQEELFEPTLNIYLRPATKADLPELVRIYNWHIGNGAAPAETREISESDMTGRINFVSEAHLPFIVAAKRSQKGARYRQVMDDEEISRRMNLPVTHQRHTTLTRIEKLAGFCCAQDMTAADYVEHISAELEIYIDPDYRKMGVGKCLLDKMLQICDRGHRLTTRCTFHCDNTIRHLYGPGGQRDVHKVFFVLRKWHLPKAGVLSIERPRYRKSAYVKTTEDDYGKWLKSWLEGVGFEEEGVLKKVGAKNGRYIDTVYLGRETAWQPAEGTLPEPEPRNEVYAQDLQDDADEAEYDG